MLRNFVSTAVVLAAALVPTPSAAGGPAAEAPTCFGQEATIVGTADSDALVGTSGPDVIVGGNGDDVINGLGGNDVLCGSTGADGLVGSSGSDSLVGGSGDDVLNGGFGTDTLLGGRGTDVCLPGPGTGHETRCERFDLQPEFPIVGTFYYPWFPESWTQLGVYPYTNYRPSLGYYDSADPAVIRAHVRAMHYGRIDVGISSWWGQGAATDQRVRRLLQAATNTNFRWTLYHELEGYGDPSVDRIRADLAYIRSHYASDQSYLRVDGRFAVFVFSADDSGCGVVNRWTRANSANAYLVFEAFPGYLECAIQPDGWHLYGGASAESMLVPHSFTINPGFWKSGEEPFLARDPARWASNVTSMTGSEAEWQLVTSFNEWGEGTAVESADGWASDSGFGTYLDALHEAVPPPAGPPNIALGRPATGSGSYRKSAASGAVDGSSEFIWNSGDYAPQWIEIDLGSPQSIGEISLLTAQSPDGDTVHRVLGKASAGAPYDLLYEFAGFTTDDQWLHHAPSAPWENVRYLRIRTIESPSWVAWREIQVYPSS